MQLIPGVGKTVAAGTGGIVEVKKRFHRRIVEIGAAAVVGGGVVDVRVRYFEAHIDIIGVPQELEFA
jgi:hypothetical protein